MYVVTLTFSVGNDDAFVVTSLVGLLWGGRRRTSGLFIYNGLCNWCLVENWQFCLPLCAKDCTCSPLELSMRNESSVRRSWWSSVPCRNEAGMCCTYTWLHGDFWGCFNSSKPYALDLIWCRCSVHYQQLQGQFVPPLHLLASLNVDAAQFWTFDACFTATVSL